MRLALTMGTRSASASALHSVAYGPGTIQRPDVVGVGQRLTPGKVGSDGGAKRHLIWIRKSTAGIALPLIAGDRRHEAL